MIRDGDIGELLTCDRCGIDFNFDDENQKANDIQDYWIFEIFKGIEKPRELWMDFCAKCAVEVTPCVYALRDVVETKKSVNKLEKAIREQKRNSDNRTNARAIGKGDAGCLRRKPECGQGASHPQTHKNYYGLTLLGDEDCHV